MHIMVFQSFSLFENWYADPSSPSIAYTHHMVPGRVAELIAANSSWALRTEKGEVYTWGDLRNVDILGRTPSAEQPADKPALIATFGGETGVRATKVVTGKHWFAALSDTGDVYAWGRGFPGVESASASYKALLPKEGVEPEPLDLEPIGVENVKDVSIGAEHMIILDEKGVVKVTGNNRNGQFGIGGGGDEEEERVADEDGEPKWFEIEASKACGKGKVVGKVVGGDASSFMIVRPS
jgi:alpha-tubulin suppressor-like RCC1 family protein